MRRTASLGLSLLATAAIATAQASDGLPANGRLEPQTTQLSHSAGHQQGRTTRAALDIFYVPIHTAAADVDGAYGTWASGHNYKVSFDEGMAFYPILGADYPENLPLHWQTTSIRLGKTQLATPEHATTSSSDWRLEIDYGRVVEAYDVLREGVEQTFVLKQRPGKGDLVIEGAIETSLQADPVDAAHQGLVFSDPNGTAIASYGAATAIDADGREIPMTTSYDGSSIRLTLSGAWLETASYPVIVDPLVSSVLISAGTSNLSAPNVARDDRYNHLLTTYGRRASAGDYDGYARITEDDFTLSKIVFADVTASWSTRNLDCASVAGASSWIVVMQRDFAGGVGIRYHTHATLSTTLSTTFHSLIYKPGDSHTVPDVGGTNYPSSGDNALVVWQEDRGTIGGTTDNSECWGVLVDVRTSTLGTKFLVNAVGGVLRPGSDLDRQRPSVTQVSSGGNGSWVCAYQEFDNAIANDDWDLRIARRRHDGSNGGAAVLGHITRSLHGIMPKVAGREGRYMLLYGELTNSGKTDTGWGSHIWAQRFEWLEGSNLPASRPSRLIRTSPLTKFWNGDIAFDHETLSHFCAVYHSDLNDVYADRIGYDSGIAEGGVVYSAPGTGYSPGVTFDDDSKTFPIAFATWEGTARLYGRVMTYKSATNSLYGSGCGGLIRGESSMSPTSHAALPHAGNGFYSVRLDNAAVNSPAALWIALAPGKMPLAGLGAPGCSVLINLNTFMVGLGGTTSATGDLSFEVPLPSVINGDIYFQYVYLSAGANALGALATRGLKAEVR